MKCPVRARRHPLHCVRMLLDLLLPPACPGCGREGDVLCDACAVPFRRRMAEPAGSPLGLPVELPDGVLQLEWCAAFSGPVRAAVHALKYGGERRLVEPLAALMAERWRRTVARWRSPRPGAGSCRAAAGAWLRPGRGAGTGHRAAPRPRGRDMPDASAADDRAALAGANRTRSQRRARVRGRAAGGFRGRPLGCPGRRCHDDRGNAARLRGRASRCRCFGGVGPYAGEGAMTRARASPVGVRR